MKKVKNKKKELQLLREKIVKRYFKEKNYGFTNPKTDYYRYLLYKMFNDFYFENDNFNFDEFKKALVKNEKAVDYLLKTIDYKYEVNFKDEMFEEEAIRSELAYINSKWYCYHRLLFLQKLIELYKA